MSALSVRTALAITMFIGFLYAVIGLMFSPTLRDFGIGVAIVAAAVIGQGLVEWLER